MLASDLNNRNFTGAQNPDDLLSVTFYKKAQQDNFKSLQEGKPVFFDVDYVRILSPGNNLSVIETPVRPEHKLRFPRQWAIYQNSNTGEQIIGMPLSHWPEITPAQIEELNAVKFHTVEQLANASDYQVQQIGMSGNMLRTKAKAYLDAMRLKAIESRPSAELEQKDIQIKTLEGKLMAMAEQFERLEKKLSEQEPKVKRKYTRKPKEEVQESST